jgi:hypothetical protein
MEVALAPIVARIGVLLLLLPLPLAKKKRLRVIC